MRLYWEIGKREFQRLLAYRTANLAGLLTNAFFGYVRAAILLAAFAGHGTVSGYDATDVVTFTWVTQALIMVVNLWGGLEVGETIRNGSVVSDLSKPFSYLGYWLARDVGRATYFLLFRCLPILLVGQVAFALRWPQAPLTLLVLPVSVALAVVIGFAWSMMLELTGFWTVQTKGIRQLAVGVMLFFSGFIVPIPLFPEWLAGPVMALPFAGVTQIPCDIFLERLGGAELFQALAYQAAWAAVMLAAARGVVGIATRRVVTHGG